MKMTPELIRAVMMHAAIVELACKTEPNKFSRSGEVDRMKDLLSPSLWDRLADDLDVLPDEETTEHVKACILLSADNLARLVHGQVADADVPPPLNDQMG